MNVYLNAWHPYTWKDGLDIAAVPGFSVVISTKVSNLIAQGTCKPLWDYRFSP